MFVYLISIFVIHSCQFVVKSSGDYKPYTCSPDLLVDWPLIEQIHQLNSTEEPQCPICLYHPVAAKMTRCGHVYCWPCILHYLALSEKKSWRKCPICYEAVHISDLKSTIAKPHRNFGNDDFVTLQLMYRDKDSLRVYCAAGHRENVVAGTDPFSYLTDVEENVVHSKLLLARPMEIMSIIGRERNELKCQLTSEGLECPDSVFVQQALSLLDERESLVKSELEIVGDVDVGCRTTNDALLASSTGAMLNADAAEYVPIGCGAVDSVDDADGASSETASCDDNLLADDIGHLTINDINITQAGSNPNAKRFYFYQAKDGQHLYLHSVNVRMLQTMYGSLEQAPHTIIGRILQKEVCSMSDELRKRLKYLQHLPVSCQFEVVEIAFDRTMVSKEVQAKFQDEIDHRQTVRQRRARAEQKRDKQIDLANERQIGKIIRTSANIDVTSDQQFPIVNIAQPSLILQNYTFLTFSFLIRFTVLRQF